ncbi:MAG: protein-tyrosine-phosphatase [Planctomycetaceae bacterium]|nr:protein-tyrosine-phosphatase [Planctomycetaceae bacterium]
MCLRIMLVLAAACSLLAAGDVFAREVQVNEMLAKYIAQREQEFDEIPAQRQSELAELSEFVRQQGVSGKPALLTFICTHNSRRSHLSQIWAATAAAHYGVNNVETFSGGTEATAFNPRAIASLQRAGFTIEVPEESDNPRYSVQYSTGAEPLVCFSKVYNSEPNPTSNYCAVMTCSDADEKCPIVQGAAKRLAVKYDDPKAFDGTPLESSKYDERCAQIAREMLFAFSLLK